MADRSNTRLRARPYNARPESGKLLHAPPRKTIALVDDDDSVRKALERQLHAAGYRCVSFASGEEFLAVAATLGAACLLADIHLGGMSGLELAVHPKVTNLELPVVLISRMQRSEDRSSGARNRRCFPAQADHLTRIC